MTLFHNSLPWIGRLQTFLYLPLPLLHCSVRQSPRLLQLLESTLRPLSCCKRFRKDNPAETVSTDWNTKSRVKGSVIPVRESVRLLVSLSRRPLYNRSDAHPFHVTRKFHEQSRCREFRRHEFVQCCSSDAYSLLASSRLFTVSQFEGNEYCKCFEGGDNQGGLLRFGEDPRPLFVCNVKGSMLPPSPRRGNQPTIPVRTLLACASTLGASSELSKISAQL